jgi:hypothetical protein
MLTNYQYPSVHMAHKTCLKMSPSSVSIAIAGLPERSSIYIGMWLTLLLFEPIDTGVAVLRWINTRVDMLGALFSAALATYLVYGGGATPLASNIGFSLNMAVSFSAMILSWVTLLNAFEVSGK